ncbi:putative thioredoxin [Fusarium austroafricanum]|uniref:Putative thioredoxin n=1 Tax=Fusarium austroafricanum TaxID=2364996 RepID=A0A8H4KTV2_9HYPO|nr:putative thioredoxin [Fusarium austroafricanum]
MAQSQSSDTSDPIESKEALVSRLRKLVDKASVMLFMKGTPKFPVCRFSRRIIRVLNDHGIIYDSSNVLTDEAVRQGMKEFADWPTFPQLWVDGELVGGLDIVKEKSNTTPDFLSQYSVQKDATEDLKVKIENL